MSEEKIVVKDDWKTILGELDEIVRELAKFSSMTLGDINAFEGEEFPALIHFINELKMEKKNKSWEKIEQFASLATENLKFLEETQQIKMQDRLLDRTFIGTLPKNTEEIGKKTMEILNELFISQASCLQEGLSSASLVSQYGPLISTICLSNPH